MGGSVKVVGFIDQVRQWRTGELQVRDIKTGTRLPDSPLQLAVYALAVAEMPGGSPVETGTYYMAKNHEDTKPYRLDRYSRERLTDWFQRMDAGVRGGVYLPNPGGHCRTCGVWEHCSIKGLRAQKDEVG